MLAGEEVRLEGFNGFDTYVISNSNVSGDGHFVHSYSADDVGMGYLISSDDQSFILVLSSEDIELKGEVFTNPESIEILSGEKSQLFEQYASKYPRREQVLSS